MSDDNQGQYEEGEEIYENAMSRIDLSIYNGKLRKLRSNISCFAVVNREHRPDPDIFCTACDKQTILLSNPLSGYHKTCKLSRVFNHRDNNVKIVDSLEYLISGLSSGQNVVLSSVGQHASLKSKVLFGNGYNGVSQILMSRLFSLYEGDETVQFSISVAAVTKTKAYDLLISDTKTQIEVDALSTIDYRCLSKHIVSNINDCCRYIRNAQSIGYDNVSQEVMLEYKMQTTIIVYFEVQRSLETEVIVNHMIFADLLSTEYLVTPSNPIIQSIQGTLANHPLIYLLKELFVDDAMKCYLLSLRPELEHADYTIQSLYFAGLLKQIREFKPNVLQCDENYKSRIIDLRTNVYQTSLDHAALVDYVKEEFDTYPNEIQLTNACNNIHKECEKVVKPLMEQYAKVKIETRKWEEISELELNRYKDTKEEYDILDNKYKQHKLLHSNTKKEIEQIHSIKNQLDDEKNNKLNEINNLNKKNKKLINDLKTIRTTRESYMSNEEKLLKDKQLKEEQELKDKQLKEDKQNKQNKKENTNNNNNNNTNNNNINENNELKQSTIVNTQKTDNTSVQNDGSKKIIITETITTTTTTTKSTKRK